MGAYIMHEFLIFVYLSYWACCWYI